MGRRRRQRRKKGGSGDESESCRPPLPDAIQAEILAGSLLVASMILQLPPEAAGSGSNSSLESAPHWLYH